MTKRLGGLIITAFVACFVSIALTAIAAAQPPDKKEDPQSNPPPPPATAPEATTPPKPTNFPDAAQMERDNKLKESLQGAIFEGTWQMTGEGGLAGAAPLSGAHHEKYAISNALKGAGDNWVITARIQFAEKDVQIPVPVRIIWAGNTPVITLDEMALPLLGSYSARVMIHEGFYSGIWYSKAKNYGGVMSGRIRKATAADVEAKPVEPKPVEAKPVEGKPVGEKPTQPATPAQPANPSKPPPFPNPPPTPAKIRRAENDEVAGYSAS